MRGQSLHRKLLEQTVKVIQNQHAISALNGCRNLIGEIYLRKKVDNKYMYTLVVGLGLCWLV